MVLSQWERVILTLVTRAVCSVEPPTQERASTDLLQFVKVKTVPGGVSTASITGSGITTAGDSSKLAEVLAAVLPGDCEYINGVMFRKILPHKLMREDIVRPKVLLLDGNAPPTPPCRAPCRYCGYQCCSAGRAGVWDLVALPSGGATAATVAYLTS